MYTCLKSKLYPAKLLGIIARKIRNKIPKTLLSRFIVIITAPLIIGQLLTLFFFYDRHWYNVSYYNSKLISAEIDQLLSNILLNEPSNIEPNVRKQYLNFQYVYIPNLSLPKKQKRLSEELEIFKNILNSKIHIKNIIVAKTREIEVLFQHQGGVLQVMFAAKILVHPSTNIFVILVVVITILFLSISIAFSKKQISSILSLTKAAEAFGQGLPYLYIPTGAAEIRYAGYALLKMKKNIEQQVAKRAEMLAMISHDLRTPLTRMKLRLELMNNADEEEKQGLKQDVESMESLIYAYLTFVRGVGGEKFEAIDIIAWMQKIIQSKWNHLHIIQNLKETSLLVHIKPIAFERAINNILSNAQKYANIVKMSIYSLNDKIVLDIEDDGIGIPDNEKQKVFMPFYRADHARSFNDLPNVGLGLAITKEIITDHHGIVILKDSLDLKGLMVRIELPYNEGEPNA